MPTSSVIMNSMPPVSAIELPPKASTCTQCAHYSSSPSKQTGIYLKAFYLVITTVVRCQELLYCFEARGGVVVGGGSGGWGRGKGGE